MQAHSSPGIFPPIEGGSVVKDLPASAGDLGLITGLERSPAVGTGNPLVFPPGQRSLAGSRPWGREELHASEHSSSSGLFFSTVRSYPLSPRPLLKFLCKMETQNLSTFYKSLYWRDCLKQVEIF